MTITVEDAKAHMNVTGTDDDALIAGKIAAAEAWIATFIGATISPAPEPIKEAVRQLTAHLFENREATLVGVSADLIPFGVHDLIAPYREWEF